MPLLPRAGQALPPGPALIRSRSTDIRIVEVDHAFEDFRYRAPYQFGGRSVDRVTLLNVELPGAHRRRPRGLGLRVDDARQRVGVSRGLAGRRPRRDEGACRRAARRHRRLRRDGPSDRSLPRARAGVSARRGRRCRAAQALPTPIPKLCTLVVASAFDAALHDAYGKAFGAEQLRDLRPRVHEPRSVRTISGAAFKGEYLDRYVPAAPRPRMPVFHSVGASDPLEAADVGTRVDDGLPNTLEEWIPRDGLIRFKIKLNGGDLDADFERVVRIDRVVHRAQAARGGAPTGSTRSTSTRAARTSAICSSSCGGCARRRPAGFDRILYIEQPTARDLKKDRANVMHEAAKLRPVVIDESLTDLETLLLAREMGYTGVALKACKGQSQAMLMAAAAQKFGMFLCVQDLTCPGASLIHSAGIAARVPGNAGIEANARQFVPAANAAWEARFPGLFTIRDGVMHTGQLTGAGARRGAASQVGRDRSQPCAAEGAAGTPRRSGLRASASRQLTRQEVDHTFERIEAEGRGNRRPQVGVGVDVVEHAPAVEGLEVFDAADVESSPRGRSAAPCRRRPWEPPGTDRTRQAAQRSASLGRQLARRRRRRRRVAHRRGAQIEPPVRDDAHRVEQLAAEKLEAGDAALGIVREILLEQEQVVGQPDVRDRVQRSPRPAPASRPPECARRCLPGPASAARASGSPRAYARSARGSLNVIDRGQSIPSVRRSVACALLLNSSANTSAPLRTRAPSSSSERMYASASGTARVLPRT